MLTYDVRVTVVESLRLEFLFFPLEGVEFLGNIGVDEVCDVLAIHDLRDNIHFPFRVRK